MTHDPMCRGRDGVNDCHCALIARVRAAALDAARDAVAAVPGVGSHTPGMGNTLGRKHALAAIDALRGES